MKYMLLMNATRSGWESFGKMKPHEIQAHIEFMKNLNAELAASKELVDAQGLTLPQMAKTVRAQAGAAPVVTDGPFPETKEFLAGYWLLECKTPARAVEIAARISAAPGRDGKPINFEVELRPVGAPP
jgi:hypothetical protein